jgi:hypothetical protein
VTNRINIININNKQEKEQEVSVEVLSEVDHNIPIQEDLMISNSKIFGKRLMKFLEAAAEWIERNHRKAKM